MHWADGQRPLGAKKCPGEVLGEGKDSYKELTIDSLNRSEY